MKALVGTCVLLLIDVARAGTNKFGLDFLAKMKKEPGVVTLDSGLMYRVLVDGDGEQHPLRGTQCSCHYEGRTAQEYSKSPKGKKFDSSYDRGDPTSFAPSGVIAGWTEAMQLMVEGDKWEMFIPSELGYGDQGSGADIKGGDVLVFTMEILKIEGEGRPAEPKGPQPWTDLEGDVAKYDKLVEGGSPLILAVLRQPITASKVFTGFKRAAKAGAKAADGVSYAITAASKFSKGAYAVDELAKHLKLDTPAVYTALAGGSTWTKCKIGRPTETTVEAIEATISDCAAQPKSEL